MVPFGLYVHVPFCSDKCAYCDFASFPGERDQCGRYLEALEAEAAMRPREGLRTLYIGGGTPTELSAEELTWLFGMLRRRYRAAGCGEATCEANPESLTFNRLEALRRGGISRLSLGLQAADDRLLRLIGRRHTWEDSLAAFRAAREAGMAVSVDLIHSLPEQTLRVFRSGLDAVLSLEPQHVSLYGLEVHEGTRLYKSGSQVDEDLGREMFELALDRLKAAGYHHYEISNFALPGHESLHNLGYWRNEEYVGLGCAAVSHEDGTRSKNVERVRDYCDQALAGKRPEVGAERLTGLEKLGESLMLGLRLVDGFAPCPEAAQAFEEELDGLARRGLIERDGPRVRPTRDGIFFNNVAAAEFVAPFSDAAVNRIKTRQETRA